MTSLKLAILNLTRRKVPTAIAILAIALSVACAGILLRLNILAESRFSTLGKGGDAIVGAKSGGIEIVLGALNAEGKYPGFLPMKLYQTLAAETTVRFEDGAQATPSSIRAIIPFLYFAKYEDFRVVGTSESFLKRPVESDSLSLQEGTWAQAPGDVVLGSAVAKSRGLKLGDSLYVKAWLGDKIFISANVPLKVVGILSATASSWDRLLYTDLETAQSTVAKAAQLGSASVWGPQVLNYFLVYLKPNGFEPLSALINNRTVGQVIDVQDEKLRLADLVGTGKSLGLSVTVLILVLGGLSVTSMLVTRFEAMSLQLAVLRAIGYKKKAIGAWLLWEGFLLGLVACMIGLVLDAIFFPGMRALLGEALPTADIVASSIFQSYPVWITALLATTLSVFVPLYRVYHQDIHFSLRS